MKKKLYFITSDFPYGKGETSFIMPELPFLKDKFDITIISHSLQWEQTVNLDEDIKVIHYDRRVSLLWKLWDSICFFGNKDAYLELWDIICSRKAVIKRFLDSILFFEEARRFKRFLQKNKIIDCNEPAIIYSYWFTYYCLTMTWLFAEKPHIKIVTRAHRYDLYEEGYLGQRQPFKIQMNQKVDEIIFIAEHGRKYYTNKYYAGVRQEKHQLFRLGVAPVGVPELRKKTNDEFVLVSCAMVVPRKRVELIVEALGQITDFQVRWIHFGDGENFEKLCIYAKQLLGTMDNITYELKGYVVADQILQFYSKNYVDAFITTTESEGCPVSVQEAMAYGIPIIGTKIAEIPYMINGNGVLLSENPSVEEVVKGIKGIYGLSMQEINVMREKSYQLWKENFNLEVNAGKFVGFLDSLI